MKQASASPQFQQFYKELTTELDRLEQKYAVTRPEVIALLGIVAGRLCGTMPGETHDQMRDMACSNVVGGLRDMQDGRYGKYAEFLRTTSPYKGGIFS